MNLPRHYEYYNDVAKFIIKCQIVFPSRMTRSITGV